MRLGRRRALEEDREGVAATEGWRREEEGAVRCGGTAVHEGRSAAVWWAAERCARQSG